MRHISDRVEGVSPMMVKIIVGASLLGFVPLVFMLVTQHDPTVGLLQSSADYKILCCVLLSLIIFLAITIWLFTNMKIEIKGDNKKIQARIFPFMRSFRTIDLEDISKMEIIKIDGLMKYGGVGYKNNLGNMTSYTLHIKGHTLRILLSNKKEIHVEITKIEEWRSFIQEFEKRKT